MVRKLHISKHRKWGKDQGYNTKGGKVPAVAHEATLSKYVSKVSKVSKDIMLRK